MNKLVVGGMSTLSAVVLLMSYPTSMNGKDANVSLDAALPVTEAGDSASTEPTPSATTPAVSETSPSPTTTTPPPEPTPTTTTTTQAPPETPKPAPTTTTPAPQLEKPKPQPVKPTQTPKPAKPKPQPVKPKPVQTKPQPIPQPTKPTEQPKPQPVGKQRINGPTIETKYGPVQATIVVEDGVIRRAGAAQYPAGSAQSRRINQMAVPDLIRQTLVTQSADIDMVSGATTTSRAFRQSLQAAINKANL